MKNYFLYFTLFSIFLFNVKPLHETSDLGEVKFSMLPPNLFKIQHGTGWVEVNGQDVSGGNLHNFLMGYGSASLLENGRNIPNAQGKFVRAMGETDRRVGTVQDFSTAAPQEKLLLKANMDGNHIHRFHRGAYGDKNPTHFPSDSRLQTSGTGDKVFTHETTKDGDHSHDVEITSGWDKETRPANVALYIYMKVN